MGIKPKSSASAIDTFLKNVGLKEKEDSLQKGILMIVLIGTGEEGNSIAEFTRLNLTLADDRKKVKEIVNWLRCPNWKEFATKSYRGENEDLWELIFSIVHFPTDEYGFCELTSWKLLYYNEKGNAVDLDLA